MNEYLIYLLVGLICLAVGYLLGNYIRGLKTKSEQSALEEREQQLKTNLTTLEGKLMDVEEHKTHLQREKEQLGNQIVRYQADLENLELKKPRAKRRS